MSVLLAQSSVSHDQNNIKIYIYIFYEYIITLNLRKLKSNLNLISYDLTSSNLILLLLFY